MKKTNNMKKKLILIIFVLVCLFQIFVIAKMIYQVYNVNNKSQEIIVSCELYDPVNPLKGRYLYLTFPDLTVFDVYNSSFSNLSKNQLKKLINKDVFISLKKKNYYKYYEIIDVSYSEPEKGVVFLKQKVKNIFFDYKKNNYDKTSDCLNFEYSFNRYYIQEDIAVKTEQYLRNPDNKSKNITFDLTLRVNEHGDYSVGKLKINDVKIEDYFK